MRRITSAVILVENNGVVTNMRTYPTYDDAREAFFSLTRRMAPIIGAHASPNTIEWGSSRIILVGNMREGLAGRRYTDEIMKSIMELRRL